MMNKLIPLVLLFLAACGGKKDPAGLVKNESWGFALVPPAGWTEINKGNVAAFIAEHGDRLLDSSRQGMTAPLPGKNTFVVAYAKVDAPEPLMPLIGISHNSVGLPTVDDGVLQKSRAVMKAKMAASGYVTSAEQSSELVPVGDLKGARIGYTGTLNSVKASKREYQQFKIRTVDTMIASKTMTHFLNMVCDESAWTANEAVYNQVLSTFHSYGGR